MLSGGSYRRPRSYADQKGYNVEGTGEVDLGQLATKHLGIGVGSRSLEDLCATLLGQRLSKGNVHMSNWEQALSDDQVCEGCVGPSPCVSYLTQFFFLFVRVYGQRHKLALSVLTWIVP